LNEQELPCDLYECHFGGRGGAINDGDPVEFKNSTGLMWGVVREMLRTDRLTLWYNDKQISQLSNREYRLTSDGKIELERKEKMKERGVGSPDMADALALALYEPDTAGWLNVDI
jgi:hypothetical protein